jgi:uncharacterized protein (DUF983 family)
MREIAHPLFRSIGRGLAHRCPACGKGRLYGRYLKVEPTCRACGHELSLYPADDGPAYLTILLTGHLIIGPLLFFPIVWQASPFKVLPVLLGGLTAVVLAGLPRIKGGWIGMMYALQVTGRDAQLHTADAAD